MNKYEKACLKIAIAAIVLTVFTTITAISALASDVRTPDVFTYTNKVKNVYFVMASKDRPNPGGALHEAKFSFYLEQMKDNNVWLVFDGRCNSACTVVADMAKKKGVPVCVTPYAVFGYHMARNVDGTYEVPRYSQEILDLVKEWRVHGVPTYDVKYSKLRKIYRTC